MTGARDAESPKDSAPYLFRPHSAPQVGCVGREARPSAVKFSNGGYQVSYSTVPIVHSNVAIACGLPEPGVPSRVPIHFIFVLTHWPMCVGKPEARTMEGALKASANARGIQKDFFMDA
jgi:hypothetical protein